MCPARFTRVSSHSLQFRSHSARCESLNDAVIYDLLMHIVRNFSSGISQTYSPIHSAFCVS